jgi:pyruvate dehydrogenase E1 component beta subunit
MSATTYGRALCAGFDHLLSHHSNVFVMGQGLWSPWYVGDSMTDLDKKFGVQRIIDTPVSESACTSAALGASLCGYRPVVVHPRMDFMLYCMDSIVNQAAKWSHMFGGQCAPKLTVRGIINRGGEQGAQHSQALHAWFAHIPGLRVVMPSTVADARDLLVASVLCDDPVVFIDDRWLYGQTADLGEVPELDLRMVGPQRLMEGSDITLVAASFSTRLCLDAAQQLATRGVHAEVIDLRVINPLDCSLVMDSVQRTGRLLAVDGGWSTCGLAGEVIARAAEALPCQVWRAPPSRITLPDAPAPSAGHLEAVYYPSVDQVVRRVQVLMKTEEQGHVA